jgi:hypothetical protein
MASRTRRNKEPGTLGYPGGKVICRKASFSGPMRKYGNWKFEDQSPEVVMLDTIAHRQVAPMGVHGLVIRKRRTA